MGVGGGGGALPAAIATAPGDATAKLQARKLREKVMLSDWVLGEEGLEDLRRRLRGKGKVSESETKQQRQTRGGGGGGGGGLFLKKHLFIFEKN